jgi:hypothetical protein
LPNREDYDSDEEYDDAYVEATDERAQKIIDALDRA